MSRLWSRARAGLSKGPEQGKTDGMGKGEFKGAEGGRGLRKEKSTRWLRGSVVQARGE